MKRSVMISAMLGVAVTCTREANAAAPWVARPITLPDAHWAFDAGLGIAHAGGPNAITGTGVNMEGAVGITSHLELGFRTGVRGGNDGRATIADTYGRLYDWQTFGVGNDTLANPEIKVTGSIVRASIVEIALQGRGVIPFEGGTRPGFLFGVPITFHAGSILRIDTGGYVPVVFHDPVEAALVVPGDFWFQASSRFWIGPMTGARFRRRGTDVRLGMGLGYQITSFLDFKSQFYFPAINQDNGTNAFGVGAGIQIRIE